MHFCKLSNNISRTSCIVWQAQCGQHSERFLSSTMESQIYLLQLEEPSLNCLYLCFSSHCNADFISKQQIKPRYKTKIDSTKFFTTLLLKSCVFQLLKQRLIIPKDQSNTHSNSYSDTQSILDLCSETLGHSSSHQPLNPTTPKSSSSLAMLWHKYSRT